VHPRLPALHKTAILLAVAIPALAYVTVVKPDELVSIEQFLSLCWLYGHPVTIRDKHDDLAGGLWNLQEEFHSAHLGSHEITS
jgi:hypothetical protein